MTRIDFFKVDMAALKGLPNLDVLLQLLATFNEINGLGNIGRMMMRTWQAQKDADEWTNDKFYEMLAWQLFKLRISTAAEGLRNLILPIKLAEENDSMKEIWKFITERPELRAYYETLKDYLPGPDKKDRTNGAGKYYHELAIQLFIRDKMSGHHDKEPIVEALDTYLQKHQEAGVEPHGWFQDGDSGQFTRALFLDNLEMISWYSKNGIDLNFGVDSNKEPRMEELRKHVDTMLRAFSNFTSELCIAYMNEHHLLVQAHKPEWVKGD